MTRVRIKSEPKDDYSCPSVLVTHVADDVPELVDIVDESRDEVDPESETESNTSNSQGNVKRRRSTTEESEKTTISVNSVQDVNPINAVVPDVTRHVLLSRNLSDDLVFRFIWSPAPGFFSTLRFRLSQWNSHYPDVFLYYFDSSFYLMTDQSMQAMFATSSLLNLQPGTSESTRVLICPVGSTLTSDYKIRFFCYDEETNEYTVILQADLPANPPMKDGESGKDIQMVVNNIMKPLTPIIPVGFQPYLLPTNQTWPGAGPPQYHSNSYQQQYADNNVSVNPRPIVDGVVSVQTQGDSTFRFTWRRPQSGFFSAQRFRLSQWNLNYPDVFLYYYHKSFYLMTDQSMQVKNEATTLLNLDPASSETIQVSVCPIGTQLNYAHKIRYHSFDDQLVAFTIFLQVDLPKDAREGKDRNDIHMIANWIRQPAQIIIPVDSTGQLIQITQKATNNATTQPQMNPMGVQIPVPQNYSF